MRKATPTEYKGVRFRSKSEAMFARWIDIGSEFHFWKYEPQYLSVDGWTPDFLVCEIYEVLQYPNVPPLITYKTIEYKPSRPTETYIHTWKERCRRIRWSKKLTALSHFLYYGSVYTLDRGVFFCNDEFRFDWISGHEYELRNTRFDLAGVDA